MGFLVVIITLTLDNLFVTITDSCWASFCGERTIGERHVQIIAKVVDVVNCYLIFQKFMMHAHSQVT